MSEAPKIFGIPKNTQMFLDYVSKKLGRHVDGSPVYTEQRRADKHSKLQIHLSPSVERNHDLDVFELQARLVRVKGEQEKLPEQLIYWDDNKKCIILAIQEIAELGYSFDVEDAGAEHESIIKDETAFMGLDPDEEEFRFHEQGRPGLRIVTDDE